MPGGNGASLYSSLSNYPPVMSSRLLKNLEDEGYFPLWRHPSCFSRAHFAFLVVPSARFELGSDTSP